MPLCKLPAHRESAAARGCLEAAHALKEALPDVAARSELAPEDLTMRFGLHWGATLYVGQIATSGRTEVTALGDEVNEGARIEACATGGRVLASKALIERLDPEDAAALVLDPDHITTPRSPSCRARPRRPGATLRRSPSARCSVSGSLVGESLPRCLPGHAQHLGGRLRLDEGCCALLKEAVAVPL